MTYDDVHCFFSGREIGTLLLIPRTTWGTNLVLVSLHMQAMSVLHSCSTASEGKEGKVIILYAVGS